MLYAVLLQAGHGQGCQGCWLLLLGGWQDSLLLLGWQGSLLLLQLALLW